MHTNHISDLSIVIPLDLSRRSKEIYQRAVTLAKILAPTDIQLIFGCASTPEHWVSKLKKQINNLANVTLITSSDCQSQLSKLRNIAIAQVTTTYILFLDVDIIVNIEQIQQVLIAATQSPAQLCMYPCLYLTAKGTKQAHKQPISAFKQYYYQFKREWILHLAFPSSIIICDIQSVRAIEGFDENYKGHGYEDFDFMLRLFKHKHLIEYTEQTLIDTPYMAPMMAVGFRAQLAQVQLEQILQPVYFLHAYHGKDKQENYYQLRQQNKLRFQKRFTALVEHTSDHQLYPPHLLNQFFQLLNTHNMKPSEFTALWAEIPGHMFRRKLKFHFIS